MLIEEADPHQLPGKSGVMMPTYGLGAATWHGMAVGALTPAQGTLLGHTRSRVPGSQES